MKTTLSFLPYVIIKNALAYSRSTNNADTHCHVSGNGLFPLFDFSLFLGLQLFSLCTWVMFSIFWVDT